MSLRIILIFTIFLSFSCCSSAQHKKINFGPYSILIPKYKILKIAQGKDIGSVRNPYDPLVSVAIDARKFLEIRIHDLGFDDSRGNALPSKLDLRKSGQTFK